MIPALLFALAFLAIIITIIYGMVKILQIIPHYTGKAQDIFSRVSTGTRKVADGTTKPFVWFQQAGAVIKSIFRMVAINPSTPRAEKLLFTHERINIMDEPEIIETPPPNPMWKYRALLIGGSIGALVGVGAAFLLTKRAEQKGQSLAITPVKGVQLGVMLAGLLSSILSLGED